MEKCDWKNEKIVQKMINKLINKYKIEKRPSIKDKLEKLKINSVQSLNTSSENLKKFSGNFDKGLLSKLTKNCKNVINDNIKIL